MIARLPLAWRLARRELRGGVRGLGVFLGCLALGVAAIAAVGALNASVIEALERDANRLLGGDLELEVANLPLDEDELAALVPPARAAPTTSRTNAMAQRPDGRRVAVVLKAVDDAYPLYGEVRLDPADAARRRAGRRGCRGRARPARPPRARARRSDPDRRGRARAARRARARARPDRRLHRHRPAAS